MHANPQRLPIEEPSQLPSLRSAPLGPTLEQRMLRFLRLLRLSFWRAFVHDSFATAKASAYSSILTFFPVLLIIGSALASWRKGAPYLREVSYALGSILPAGGTTALSYLKGAAQHPVGTLATTCMITLWTASGVMISWMEGFRRCYELPKTWGLVKERLIAFLLVIFALIPMTFATLLVAVGSKFEARLLPYIDPDFSVYILPLGSARTCSTSGTSPPFTDRSESPWRCWSGCTWCPSSSSWERNSMPCCSRAPCWEKNSRRSAAPERPTRPS